MQDAVIVSADADARSARRRHGSLRTVRPDDMAAAVIARSAAPRAGHRRRPTSTT